MLFPLLRTAAIRRPDPCVCSVYHARAGKSAHPAIRATARTPASRRTHWAAAGGPRAQSTATPSTVPGTNVSRRNGVPPGATPVRGYMNLARVVGRIARHAEPIERCRTAVSSNSGRASRRWRERQRAVGRRCALGQRAGRRGHLARYAADPRIISVTSCNRSRSHTGVMRASTSARAKRPGACRRSRRGAGFRHQTRRA